MKKMALLVVGTLLSLAGAVGGSIAADISNYSITPPFIQTTIKPNLLLMFDNSASVFDLAYVDKGSATRQPYYCYDQTFSNANSYEGYFKPSVYYEYDMTNRYFKEIAGITDLSASTCTNSDTAKKNLCVVFDSSTPKKITSFKASGKFLNWLTASKFDVQKKALTGGKYVSGTLIAESRGCVGRGFVKEALLADYNEVGTNSSAGVSFHVKGAAGANDMAPSPGGLTQLYIYQGDYNAKDCQDAVDAYTSGANHTVIGDAVLKCLGPELDKKSLETKQKVVFQQTVQECWQYSRMADPKTVGTDAVNTVTNQCGSKNGVYASRGAGPSSITAGNADLLCSSNYAGYCFAGSAPNWNTWVAKEYATDNACIIAMHNKFCGDLNVVPVTDPTDSPSVTSSYDNLPAFIADLGVEGQLGDPLLLSNSDKSFAVKVQTAAPTGIIQEFANKIRIGGMKFNEFGSQTEATANLVPATKVCYKAVGATKVATEQQCGWVQDCIPKVPVVGETWTCEAAPSNKDGAQIFHYIGIGKCSDNNAVCTTKANCSLGATCESDPVGDHTTGFIKAINDIKGATWTPFGEAYYNTIGYFAKDTTNPAGKNSKTSLRLNTDDYLVDRNPSEYRCQDNHVLMITDGVSTTDRHTDVKDLSDKNKAPDTASQTCSYFAGSTYLPNLAWLAKNRNINTIEKNTTATTLPTTGYKNQFIKTHVVFNGENTGAAGDCEASVLLSKTAVNGGTTMYTASKPEEFLPALRTAFLSIAGGTASGTAASIVNKRQESGANLLTAVFYPEREFIPTGATTGTKIRWTGDLQNYWYYFDPYFANSGLVEDTTVDNTLNLKTDYRIDLNFSEETRQTTATRFSYDGTTYSKVDDGVPVNSLKALWRAGDLLHAASASDRTIKTNVPGTTTLIDFKDTKKADLRPYLQSPTEDEALKIINYTRGDDTADASYRNRTVTHSGVAKPWKLGDIISSTPKIQSSIQVNNYNRSYNDTSYNQFITSSDYKNRNVVYVGANDGMLHAFSLGKITAKTTEFQKASIAADGSTSPGSELWAYIPGNALPYLRYLTDPNYRHLYTVDLTTTLVDASIAGTDCSGDYWTCDRTTETAVSNWRTLLIGGMGLGGASRPANGTCATSTTIDVNTYADCVKAPINSTGYENVGLSSYFALDVTTPTSPSLKWEFSHADLGYALLEPALVRVGGAKLNGRWFAVFVSGPTGPINTSTSQFYGRSDKTLKLFVVDMATGALARTFDVTASEATIKVDDNLKTAKAFGGPLFTNAIDLDEGKSGSPSYYSTDVVYVSYTRQKKNSSNVYSWDNGSDGGMLRLLTNGSTDPANWTLTSLIDGTGPVTSSMAKMYDDRDPVTQKPVLWLYFGTGRYFYVDQESVDAANEQQYLFGFKEPCYKKDSTGYTVLDKDCAIDLAKGQVVKATHLFDSTYILSLKASDYYTTELSATKDKIGWYALLDPSDSTYNAERVITTPLVRASGVTSFTTFRPTADICGSGGATRMIFRDYRTGGMPAKGSLKGSVVVQLSTGAISKIDLASVLVTGTGSVGSKPPSIELGQGKPPGQAPQDDKPRKPVKKVLHIQEK